MFSSALTFSYLPYKKKYIMKKRLLLLKLILLLLFSNTYAQFQQGDKVFGVGLNFQSNIGKINSGGLPQTYKSTGLHLSTESGFAKKENRLNGFFINVGFTSSEIENSSQPMTNVKSEFNSVSAGYFTRRYKSLGKSFFIFGEGRAGFNFSNQNNPSTTANKLKSYGVNAGIYPGIAYKFNNRFFLEVKLGDFISIGYSRQEITGTNNRKDFQSSFSLASSLGLGYLKDLGIGARWIIPTKKK